MKRIAYLIDGDLQNRKGFVNAVLSRIKYQIRQNRFDIDVYSMGYHSGWLVRKLRGGDDIPKETYVDIDGVHINMLWSEFSILDYILEHKLHTRTIMRPLFLSRCVDVFKNYNLISVHSLEGAEIAMKVQDRYNVPFVCSWYGSDIHTAPYSSSHIMSRTNLAMSRAYHNFFVSKKLLSQSYLLSEGDNRSLLYLGVREIFTKKKIEDRLSLRKKYNVLDKKVVAFSGGFVEVKNIPVLPEIFKVVYENNKNVVFWITGDGKLKQELVDKMEYYNLPYRMFGFIPESEMPDVLNCVDVQVLPSLNEGLPMITVEALACGANVVGSNVGGIPEVCGQENVFDLGDNFVSAIANRIHFLLNNTVIQEIPKELSWVETAKTEAAIYEDAINN